jgi:DNA end-binding protein Ku
MRAIWKGSIAFGLVHIPVNLYPATETQGISSNLLHKKDHSRIRYQRVSEATGKEVPAAEIVRGFEVERDNFVVISDDELKEAAPEKSASIEIQEFVNESQIPTVYFEKPYYLEPDKGAGKAYALLREALARSGKVGVAQFVLRNRESLCVLKPQDNGLTLNTLRFASEIRPMDELRLPVSEKLAPNEVNLAMKLIEGMTADFDPANAYFAVRRACDLFDRIAEPIASHRTIFGLSQPLEFLPPRLSGESNLHDFWRHPVEGAGNGSCKRCRKVASGAR